MGFKRPFDEELQELPLKHPKQVDCGNKLTSFAEIYPFYEPPQKADIPVGDELMMGDMTCKFKVDDEVEHNSRNVVSDLADKESEITTGKDDTGSGDTEAWTRDTAILKNGGHRYGGDAAKNYYYFIYFYFSCI